MLGITTITMLWFLLGIIVGIVMIITILVVKKEFLINMALSKLTDEVGKKMDNIYDDKEKKKK